MGLFDGLMRKKRANAIRKAIDELRRTTVGDITSKYVIIVKKTDTIIQAATKMIAEDVSCLLVMDGTELQGILSERDFLRKVPLNKKVFSMHVSNIMTPNVVTVSPDVSLVEAVSIMKKNKFRRLVIEKDGEILGIITQTDFSARIAKIFDAYPISQEFIVDNIMEKPIMITKKDSFSKAKEKMKKANLAATLIVDKMKPPNKLEGYFSEYDVVMQFYDQHGQLNIREVGSFTRNYVRAINTRTNIFEANKILLDKKIHRMPIVDGSKILGILTQRHIVQFIYLSLDKIEEALQNPKTGFLSLAGKKWKGLFIYDKLKVYPTPSAERM